MLINLPTENINEVLDAAGVTKPPASKPNTPEAIRALFETNGAGVEDAARSIGTLMRNFDDSGVQLRACELALKVQGIFKDIDENKAPVVNIYIEGNGNQTLVNFLTPARL